MITSVVRVATRAMITLSFLDCPSTTSDLLSIIVHKIHFQFLCLRLQFLSIPKVFLVTSTVVLMASAVSPFVSTKETTNYARLCRLLVDVGSQALRDTFDKIHPPTSLHAVLTSHLVKAALQTLYKGKRKILNPTQWGKLYPAAPSTVSSANFDVTLLIVLLRNICGLSPPLTGWDDLPPAADTSIADDIARVKYYRNTVYGHATQASVDDGSFDTYWQEIRDTLVRLNPGCAADIDKLKNECMDPDIEEHYRELLQEWKKDDDSIKDRLEEMDGMLTPCYHGQLFLVNACNRIQRTSTRSSTLSETGICHQMVFLPTFSFFISLP